jgi:hypothetical protein
MLEQRALFLGTKRPRLPGLQAAEAQRSHADTSQAANRMSKEEEAASNLSFLSFDEGE